MKVIFMKYKLMIKIHNITKLKYLCVTSKKTMKDSPAARRWHFDNCKKKGNLDED